MKKSLFEAIGCTDNEDVKKVSKKMGVPKRVLGYYNSNHLLPSEEILEKIEFFLGINSDLVMLKMGIYSRDLMERIANNSDKVANIIACTKEPKQQANGFNPVFETKHGKLYNDDCIDLMKSMESESVDLIFADPPFNLDKFYLSKIDDYLPVNKYVDWTIAWVEECIRLLNEGGSFFLWNLPKWNSRVSSFLHKRLTFRHWIATDIKYRLPIQGRLYPSHYSLMYFVKGVKANTFKPDRLPMEICSNCYKELKDYGGYKSKMNPKGINLTDVWYDIPPVRHNKYKKRKEANELSVKLLDRVIEMASKEGDLVFDPFGGAGTTYAVAEAKKRRWIGTEIGPVDSIVDRMQNLEEDKALIEKYRKNYNTLFPAEVKSKRHQLSLWTDDTFKNNG